MGTLGRVSARFTLKILINGEEESHARIVAIALGCNFFTRFAG
jgi:hypothetical protein